jgi:quercetin dioxygenase-like cupin family protein
MSERERELPEFVREALADGPLDAAGELERLPELLSPLTPGGHSLGRLMQAIAEPPLRYAPFYDRLGRLWDLSEERVVDVLSRARDPREWRRAPLRGLKLLRLEGGPRAASANCYLAHFAAGLRFPEHRHRGHESLLLLEGSYTDGGGRTYRSGDAHEMGEASQHGFVVASDEPCVAAVRHHGIEFSSHFLRLLARLFER